MGDKTAIQAAMNAILNSMFAPHELPREPEVMEKYRLTTVEAIAAYEAARPACLDADLVGVKDAEITTLRAALDTVLAETNTRMIADFYRGHLSHFGTIKEMGDAVWARVSVVFRARSGSAGR